MSRRWLFAVIILILFLPVGYIWSRYNSSINTTQISDEGESDSVTTQLNQVATMNFADYNPMYVVEAVNALQPLGKEEALNQIETYLQNEGRNQDNLGLFWVLRVLFEVSADQGYPPVNIGTPTISPPTSGDFPRFPIVLVQDLPLMVVNGYTLGGLPEPVQAHVDYFREHGTLREQALAPGDAPEEIKSEFLQQWRAAYGDEHLAEVTQTIDTQLTLMLQE